MKALIGTLIGTLALIALLGISYISAYNTGNRLETALKATYENNQNVLAQYSNRVAEAAQVPAMQREDLKAVVTAALEARYGDEGSRALFQFLQEQNPTIDSTVYVKLQQIIESGRKDFEIAQTRLIDQKRVYETALGSFWQGTWLGIAGFPRTNLDDYKIVTNLRTEEAFGTGMEEPIQLAP